MIQETKKVLLRKLAKHGYYGGRHTACDSLSHGFPKHLIGEVKDAADELIKEGILIPKPTGYGLHVSIDPKVKSIVEKIIGIG